MAEAIGGRQAPLRFLHTETNRRVGRQVGLMKVIHIGSAAQACSQFGDLEKRLSPVGMQGILLRMETRLRSELGNLNALRLWSLRQDVMPDGFRSGAQSLPLDGTLIANVANIGWNTEYHRGL